MKKMTGIMAMLTILALNPLQTQAAAEVKNEIAAATFTQADADALVDRLYEINAMDKSAMSSSEKKELRNEVQSIRDQISSHPTVIYISGGALILIIILLIILL